MARFVGFFRSLRSAPSHEVRTAALLAGRDLRTVTGRNLKLVEEKSGQDPWVASPAGVRECLSTLEEAPVSELDWWRIKYLEDLFEEKQKMFYNGRDEEIIRISELINSFCVN